jgi:pimeloyl-ACP methyl ester carboxylesterase
VPAEPEQPTVVAVVEQLEGEVVPGTHARDEVLVGHVAEDPPHDRPRGCRWKGGSLHLGDSIGTRCVALDTFDQTLGASMGWPEGAADIFAAYMQHFEHRGRRLAYTEYGEGPRTCVLLHGLLLSQKMHRPLARELARRGNRVVTLDLLGHGASDRPVDMTAYGMTFFGEQVLGLLDHLGLAEAVIAGTSLGANTALEVAALAPDRVRGMVVEMPVLDNALLGSAIAFTPLMIALTFGEPVMRAVARATRAVPTSRVWGADVLLDTLRQDPAPGAAVLQGLFFNRVAPHKSVRRTLTPPALVIGHRRDPVHPFSDAGALAAELPNARLLEADSILELRIAPERLTDEIARFLDECWRPRESAPRRGRRRRTAGAAA